MLPKELARVHTRRVLEYITKRPQLEKLYNYEGYARKTRSGMLDTLTRPSYENPMS